MHCASATGRHAAVTTRISERGGRRARQFTVLQSNTGWRVARPLHILRVEHGRKTKTPVCVQTRQSSRMVHGYHTPLLLCHR
ncbi:hypothetical protein E2C01_001595 [Portunus trituberculatus]|uniref:Uncharacterized protein n=1 Tax=Portunus trituberculatus TaxID=210409 RepID=A0A5B7CHK8_PORTR|nr:hypothetical protein [Portunus trituberculatus]